MNVILNVDEVHAVLARVTGQVLDNVKLSEAGRDAIRAWRADHDLGSKEMDRFAVGFNEALGNHIDERTTRMLRQKGGRYVSLKEVLPR